MISRFRRRPIFLAAWIFAIWISLPAAHAGPPSPGTRFLKRCRKVLLKIGLPVGAVALVAKITGDQMQNHTVHEKIAAWAQDINADYTDTLRKKHVGPGDFANFALSPALAEQVNYGSASKLLREYEIDDREAAFNSGIYGYSFRSDQKWVRIGDELRKNKVSYRLTQRSGEISARQQQTTQEFKTSLFTYEREMNDYFDVRMDLTFDAKHERVTAIEYFFEVSNDAEIPSNAYRRSSETKIEVFVPPSLQRVGLKPTYTDEDIEKTREARWNHREYPLYRVEVSAPDPKSQVTPPPVRPARESLAESLRKSRERPIQDRAARQEKMLEIEAIWVEEHGRLPEPRDYGSQPGQIRINYSRLVGMVSNTSRGLPTFSSPRDHLEALRRYCDERDISYHSD